MCPCCCPDHPPRSHPTQTLEAKSQHPTDPRARTQLLQKEWESVFLACLEGAQWGDRSLPGNHLLAALHTNSKMDGGTSLITPRCQEGQGKQDGLAVGDGAGGRISTSAGGCGFP